MSGCTIDRPTVAVRAADTADQHQVVPGLGHGALLGVANLERRPNAVVVRGGGHQRAQRLGDPTLPTDHLAGVALRDGQLDHRRAAMRRFGRP